KGKAQWSDDTQTSLDVAESYVDYAGCNIDDIAKRFVDWFEAGGRGIGFTTSRVLWFISQGMSPFESSKLVWEESKCQLAGNGGLMRSAPIALARLNDKKTLIKESREVSMITHYDPRSTESCVLYNLLLRDLVLDKPQDLTTYLNQISQTDVIKTAEEASSANENEMPVGGYVLDTLRVALWAHSKFDNFEDALISVVNLGGDTDTNAAVTGALFGARFGKSGIPDRWLENLDQRERVENAAVNLLETFH
ncbi:ADP-ribosylglycohydrolase family protein, partial [bacterium]|nr:ADP-ribosylglycohydrolase family protein [bacterium]MBU1024897.1 ADP-ribosylglycohydrolase family protein [bacterium]